MVSTLAPWKVPSSFLVVIKNKGLNGLLEIRAQRFGHRPLGMVWKFPGCGRVDTAKIRSYRIDNEQSLLRCTRSVRVHFITSQVLVPSQWTSAGTIGIRARIRKELVSEYWILVGNKTGWSGRSSLLSHF